MNFREKIEQSREKQDNSILSGTNSELEDDYVCEFFATDNIKSLPACLDLRLPNGSRKALPYSYFTEIDFDTESGIEITTTTKKVKITGRDLSKLFDYLVAYRVRYITTNIGTDIEETGLSVKEILIEQLQ